MLCTLSMFSVMTYCIKLYNKIPDSIVSEGNRGELPP